jgi:hypothetical protein
MPTKKHSKRPEASKPTAQKKVRRFVSDHEADALYAHFTNGFDLREAEPVQEKTPRWWRRLGL